MVVFTCLKRLMYICKDILSVKVAALTMLTASNGVYMFTPWTPPPVTKRVDIVVDACGLEVVEVAKFVVAVFVEDPVSKCVEFYLF
ncbi:MAG: hypothetical protein CL512_05540 [Actinobacteria bacterium]|nr:hypothetical protein [Actinomycetota bacterium]